MKNFRGFEKLQLYINLADERHAKQYVLQEIMSSTVRKPFIKNYGDTMERSLQVSFEMCRDRCGFLRIYKAYVHKIIPKGLWSHSVNQWGTRLQLWLL